MISDPPPAWTSAAVFEGWRFVALIHAVLLVSGDFQADPERWSWTTAGTQFSGGSGLAGATSFLHINGLHNPSSEPMNAGKEEKTLLKINSLADRVSDLSETSPFLTKAVFEDISLHRDAYLEIHFPGLKPIKVELDERQTVLGRGPGCRIQLQLSNVSRLHARVSRLDEEYLLEDLESTNGTFVNGVRIHKCVLRNNDQIQMGETKILYVEEKTRQLHDPT